MKNAFYPNEDYMIISFRDLEVALMMLAAPQKHRYVKDTLMAVQEINRQVGPEKAIFNMVSATAWLTSDDQSAEMGLPSQDG